MERGCLIVTCTLLLSIGCVHRHPNSKASHESRLCITPGAFGIVVGTTTDQEVVALHGEGLYQADMGVNGGRYYRNETRSFLTVSQVGRAGVIDNLAVSLAQETPDYDPRKIPVSARINAEEGLGNTKGLHLGATRSDVREVLGEGTQDLGNPTVWFYDVGCSSTQQSIQLVLVFEKDRVVSATFWKR